MYKTIVVGTDGSQRAAVAVEEAIAQAKAAGATLHIVHVVHAARLRGEYDDPALVAAANATIFGESERICAQVAADAKREGVSTQIHSIEGDPADVLLRVTEDERADLLVIGNRGMSGIKRFVLGSVPNKVSHHCPCSLLIVNTDAV
jgi:nucleotide-binding universal stress UspA family protein